MIEVLIQRQVDQHVSALISEVKHNGPVKNKVCIVVSHVCCYKGDRQTDTQTDRQESGKVDENKDDTCEQIAERNKFRDGETDSWDPE
jgi:hypothetical protein